MKSTYKSTTHQFSAFIYMELSGRTIETNFISLSVACARGTAATPQEVFGYSIPGGDCEPEGSVPNSSNKPFHYGSYAFSWGLYTHQTAKNNTCVSGIYAITCIMWMFM